MNILNSIANNYNLFKAAKRYCRNPPGHFYSPVVNVDEVLLNQDRIWNDKVNVQAIDLNEENQLNLLDNFARYYSDQSFPESFTKGSRYYLNNKYYSYTDGLILYSFLRHYKPKRVIEIGSGFSSALMLDTLDRFNLEMKLTFIEPYPNRLNSLLYETDRVKADIIERKLQEVPIEYFKILKGGDILFVDSTHVCKTGSDVNYVFFEILPILEPGVIVHIHDIFDSFEYPKQWIIQKRSWNEAYLLRAFFMYNNSFRILLFPNFLHTRCPDAFTKMPLCYKDFGASLWFQKI